jgi:hypothetical protein
MDLSAMICVISVIRVLFMRSLPQTPIIATYMLVMAGLSRTPDLALLSKLTRLRTLSIKSSTREQRMSLRNIPASLVELKFCSPFSRICSTNP